MGTSTGIALPRTSIGNLRVWVPTYICLRGVLQQGVLGIVFSELRMMRLNTLMGVRSKSADSFCPCGHFDLTA